MNLKRVAKARPLENLAGFLAGFALVYFHAGSLVGLEGLGPKPCPS